MKSIQSQEGLLFVVR